MTIQEIVSYARGYTIQVAERDSTWNITMRCPTPHHKCIIMTCIKASGKGFYSVIKNEKTEPSLSNLWHTNLDRIVDWSIIHMRKYLHDKDLSIINDEKRNTDESLGNRLLHDYMVCKFDQTKTLLGLRDAD